MFEASISVRVVLNYAHLICYSPLAVLYPPAVVTKPSPFGTRSNLDLLLKIMAVKQNQK